MIYTFIFYFIAALTVILALCTVLAKNVFSAAIALALMLLSVAGVYFYLEAEFLAIAQVLVYVGAIIILFVFAIMLTARIEDASIRQTNDQILPSAIAALALFGLLCAGILGFSWQKADPGLPVLSLEQLGESLMTIYVFPFEFVSLILLSALIGAIVIGKVKKP